MPVAFEQFVKQLEESGVISSGKLAAFLPPSAHPKDAQELARQLVQSKHLTKYQAQEIYAGRAKSLILGNYTIIDKIGAGGMGQVFKAEHRRMKRIVALKMLPGSVTKDAAAVARFQREVEAAARLRHTNIVAADDADEAGGVHFLVMEYVDGKDLSALVKEHGPFPIAKAVECIRQAALGLAYAHKRGVIHRDIKPANLLLDSEGTVKILDMGLARLESQLQDAASVAGLTQSGQVMGTVDYMSPEQAEETRGVDARADQYSLGCSLWVLLTGRPMYGGTTTIAKLMAHRTQPAPSLCAARADAPPALETVYQRMVAKEPNERYASMDEVIAALATCLGDAPPATLDGPSSTDSRLTDFFQQIGGTKTAAPPKSVTAVDEETQQLQPAKQETGTAHKNMPVGSAPLTKNVASPTSSPQPTIVVQKPAERPLGQASPTTTTSKRNIHPLALVVGIAIAGLASMGLLLGLLFWFFVPSREPEPEKTTAVVASDTPTPARFDGAMSHSLTRNYALQFDGVDDYAIVTGLKIPSSTSLTIEGYVRETSPQNNPAVLMELIFDGNDWTFVGKEDDGYISTSNVHGAGNNHRFARNIWKDKWTHIAYVWDGRSGSFYVSGKKIVSNESFNYHVGALPTVLSFGAQFRPNASNHFAGYIKHVRVSTIARYVTDFVPPSSVKRFKPDSSTLALYHFDEGQGDVLRDSSGNNHHGKIVGAKWVRLEASADELADRPPPAIAPFDATAAKRHQQAWSDYLGVPVEKEITLPGGKKLTMVLIPPGEFLMGSNDEERAKLMAEAQSSSERWIMDWIPSEGPQHRVRITQPFYLGKHEVTQAQWTALMGNNPAAFQGDASQPVEQVSWNDIQPFLAKLNADAATAGMKFVLPTEAQWEYACRAGTTTTWHCGEIAETVPQYAWINANSSGKPRPVGQLQANGYGLHDMLGNVWERCVDWQAMDYYAKSPVDDPPGAAFGTHHVERGGSFLDGARVCRSASHFHGLPETRGNNHGFRVAASIDAPVPFAYETSGNRISADDFALEFDGATSYVELPWEYEWNGQSLTMEAWAYLDELPKEQDRALLWVECSNQFVVAASRTSPRWFACCPQSARSVGKNALAESKKWQHVSAVWDGKELRLFVDGKEATDSFSAAAITKINLRRFFLGGYLSEGKLNAQFKGRISQVRVSQSVRYRTDFVPSRDFANDAATLALYHFEEGRGEILGDSSGNNHHGKIVGAKWVKVAKDEARD